MPISVRTAMPRPQCHYGPQNGRFLIECDFSKQYHLYYRKRLEKTRPKLEARCRQKWDPTLPISSLAKLSNPKRASCIIIGTIFKKMKLQPDVIEELSHGDFDINSEPYNGLYTSQDDILTLEDDEESVQLAGNIDPNRFVTGVTVALLGSPMNDGGRFHVDDVCYVEPRHHNFQELANTKSLDVQTEPVYLLVVSSLGFRQGLDEKSKLTRALQDMIDFVSGGGKFSEDKRSSRVARVLVVGNSLDLDRNSSLDDNEAATDSAELKKRQARPVKSYADSIQATSLMDDFFAQLSKTVDVDLMPGHTDPSSHLMPQQPIHPCMFPKSSMFPTFSCTTNPHNAIYGDAEVLATSGQNVDVIKKFSGISDPIEIMKCHLQWGNTAPSAPDNLFGVPYEDEDPFIMETTPDIYIAGCQESFNFDYYVCEADKKYLRTLLLTIPEFHKTFTCVLIDLKNLEPQALMFD